ncbi:MAG: hypothetical protein NC213_01680 [Acetobacter sp.]|nr:hypothetical protein [Bacteroides sp.]MCM1340438.1 hypothetical protein [Acetobacter sp.]MCM1432915.1 hypothetical protein [Clostridiales bacterium]
MRRKTTAFAMTLMLIMLLTSLPFQAFSADKTAASPKSMIEQVSVTTEQEKPKLVSISFKNAVIDQSFSSDIMNYTITLNDNTMSPSLEDYSIKGSCELFVSYIYDEANKQAGIMAKIEYATGSTIYTFIYSNPAEYDINSNNHLSEIECIYGEISPEISKNESTYKLYIPQDLTNLVITPVAEDINAHCAPIELTLSVGQEVDIPIICTASDGSIREYCIKLKRVDKSIEQVKEEIENGEFVSLIKGTRFYENEEFLVVISAVAGGIIVILLLYKITKRIAANTYDKDEKPFYRSE